MSDLPVRIQLSRAKGWRMPENTVNCARGPGRLFGNPWVVGNPGRLVIPAMLSDYHLTGELEARQAVVAFRCWMTTGNPPPHFLPPVAMFTTLGRVALWKALDERRAAIQQGLTQLRGKNLACWCKLGTPCHADVLLELANREPTP